MKRILFGALFLMLAAAAAQARTVTLDAEVHDSNGNLVTGTHDVTVRIYTSSTGGTPIWTEYHTSVAFTNGKFTINVGGLTSGGVPESYFDGSHYAGVTVSNIGLGELGPRIQLASNEITWTGFW